MERTSTPGANSVTARPWLDVFARTRYWLVAATVIAPAEAGEVHEDTLHVYKPRQPINSQRHPKCKKARGEFSLLESTWREWTTFFVYKTGTPQLLSVSLSDFN